MNSSGLSGLGVPVKNIAARQHDRRRPHLGAACACVRARHGVTIHVCVCVCVCMHSGTTQHSRCLCAERERESTERERECVCMNAVRVLPDERPLRRAHGRAHPCCCMAPTGFRAAASRRLSCTLSLRTCPRRGSCARAIRTRSVRAAGRVHVT